MTIELRDYQVKGMAKLWDYFKSGNQGNPVLAWPCGAGKTICPAIFIKYCLQNWPETRFLLVTSVSELVKQNAEALLSIWPNVPLGIYSASLKTKNSAMPVVYGSIQSMSRNPSAFGFRDIIWCDEAHLIPPEKTSLYQTFFSVLKLINPNLRIIGLTGTPFRAGLGLITENGIFTDIIHNICTGEAFNKLIQDGYLAPLISKRTKTELDVSSVGINNGEFIANQLQAAVDIEGVTYNALKEAIELGSDRRSWLAFASGIEHSNHIADMLTTFGIDCASVHSKQSQRYNDEVIAAFKNYELRAISSYSKIAIGFNHPGVDFIIDLRPTLSTAFHVQKYGRALRPAEGKVNGLILDFARNVPRLGQINAPIIPYKKGEKQGDIPIKICDHCGAYNHISARICCNCAEEFEFKIKILPKAGTEEIIKSDLPIVETFDVQKVIYAAHNKIGSPTSMKISYFTGMQMFNEWMLLEHGGLMGKKARDLWRQMHKSEPPPTVTEALKFVSELRPPRKIKVWLNRKYPEILSREF